MDASSAGPLEADGFEFLAKSQNAIFADVEGIVVKEKFLGLRKHFVRLLEFARHAVHRSHAPRVAGKRLGPKTKRAQSRAASRRIKRNIGIQEEWNVIIFDLQILLVDFGGERQFIKLRGLQQRARRIVDYLAVLHVARAQDF